MIFNIKKHNTELYNTLLHLSRNEKFYRDINLSDTFETRIYLMFIHFSVILILFKKKAIKFPQYNYDSLFFCIENNLRELGFGDVSVNKKMKDMNKILYDILLKFNLDEKNFKINKNLIFKYFDEFQKLDSVKYELFEAYLIKFYDFCFELRPETMIKDILKFKV